jgi:hypothetical protein
MHIIDLHQQKKYNENEYVIETWGLIDFDGININEHKQMTNAFQSLHCNQYLFYNHRTTMINEYNNLDSIPCMFPTLISFKNWCPWKEQQTHKIITTNSCKTFNEFGQNLLLVFKRSFISNVYIQHNIM